VCFHYGFAKSARDTIGPKELARLKSVAKAELALSDEQIRERLRNGTLTEVNWEDEDA